MLLAFRLACNRLGLGRRVRGARSEDLGFVAWDERSALRRSAGDELVRRVFAALDRGGGSVSLNHATRESLFSELFPEVPFSLFDPLGRVGVEEHLRRD